MTDSTLSGDSAGGGGGLYNKAGTATLQNCTITGGWGFIDGGNLDNQTGAALYLSYCQVSGGVAEIGGGLYNAGTATFTDCTISGNNATGSSGGGQGGGISNGPLQSTAVAGRDRQHDRGNTAKLGGGGVYNNGTATLTDSTIANNFANQEASLLASNGGGLDNDGTATVVACTISGNTTTAAGGGVYNGGLGPDVAILDDTIVAGNTTPNPGGIASDIAISTAFPRPVSGSYDLIGPGGSGEISGTLRHHSERSDQPRSGALGDYGGPTETMALENTSAAIGAGSSDIPGVTDSVDRPARFPTGYTNATDIGAYQADSIPLVVNVTTDGVGAPSAEMDLRAAVNLDNLRTECGDDHVRPDSFRDRADDHPRGRSADAQQYERHHDSQRSHCRLDDQR